MLSPRLVGLFFTITLGTSFNYGFHSGVMNQPLEMIEMFIANVSRERGKTYDQGVITTLGSFCTTALVLGGMIGGGCGGIIANKVGRKKAVILLYVPHAIGCLLMIICKAVKSFEVIIAGRIITGFACGAYTAVGPLYLAEVAPPRIRGGACVLNHAIIVASVVISQVIGLRFVMGTEELWPYLIGFGIFPCFIGVVLLLFYPDSPRYLFLVKHDRNAAESALRRLRNNEEEVMEELNIMAKESGDQTTKTSLVNILRTPHLRLAFWVAIVSQLGNQLAAENGVIYYSVKLLNSCGIHGDDAQYANIGLGMTMFIGAFISAFIIDRVGRRKLLLGGFIGIVVVVVLFTGSSLGKDVGGVGWLAYVCVVLTGLFNISYNIGPGPVPWFLPAELFTQEHRDVVTSVAAFTSWLCNIAVGLGFVQLVAYIPDYSFLPSMVIVLLSLIYLWIYLPETKGRSPQSVEGDFKRMTRWKEEHINEEAGEQPDNNILDENSSARVSQTSVEISPEEESKRPC